MGRSQLRLFGKVEMGSDDILLRDNPKLSMSRSIEYQGSTVGDTDARDIELHARASPKSAVTICTHLRSPEMAIYDIQSPQFALVVELKTSGWR